MPIQVRYYLAILFILLFVAHACNDGFESPKQVDPRELNEKIINGMQAKAEWASTPLSTVKALLPRVSHSEGFYILKEKRLSEDAWIIIIDEGPLDDEVYQQRTIVDSKLTGDRWEIKKMKYSLRRRD